MDPIILAPKIDNPFDEIEESLRPTFEKRYSEQRKTAVNFSDISEDFPTTRIYRCIPLKELEPGEGGIKYKSRFIKDYLVDLEVELGENPTYSEVLEISDRILFRLSSKDLKMK